MTEPPDNVLKLPLEQRAEMALKAAVEKVIVEHARQGLPIYIWREGKVVEMSLKELRKRSAKINAGTRDSKSGVRG
ncbi:MAG: hypothetical protein ABSF45_25495 [Terriglobia bacterium]|jgi:hypothetical protein